MSEAITFEAIIFKVQTLVDYGLRVTLDLPEDAVTQAAQLMECKRQGIPLLFDVKTVDNKALTSDDIQKRPKRKS